jgi:hypothetical protein
MLKKLVSGAGIVCPYEDLAPVADCNCAIASASTRIWSVTVCESADGLGLLPA